MQRFFPLIAELIQTGDPTKKEETEITRAKSPTGEPAKTDVGENRRFLSFTA